MNVHLVSFGAPFNTYLLAHQRVLQNAKIFGQFSTTIIFSENDIFDFCPEIIPYKNFLLSTRGFGYWMWKSFLVSRIMDLVPDGDLICYADIGCTFNPNGIERFKEYCALTLEYGSLCFDLGHLERSWTKMDTYKKIFPEKFYHLNTGQRLSGIFLLRILWKIKIFFKR